ncbi:MAG: hypothetical protein DYG91_04735 [Chloroflexi bacterium CFX7]|nr:hypothetical protein [Chloroflexi bacterium CFX7]
MRFADRLRSGQFAVALEITPPQRPLQSVLLRRASALGHCADAVNVIQRPGRQSSLDASISLLRTGIEPVWHLVTRGASRGDIARDLVSAREAGIGQILVIRGDHATHDLPDTPAIREAIGLAREALPGALIGATFNQYAPDPGAALRNLLPKLRAGADFIQTQPVFDPQALAPFVQRLRDECPGVAFVPMVVPLLSPAAVDGIQRRLGFRLPEQLARRLAGGPESGWEVLSETIAGLVASPLADGAAIMTTEMDPPPAVGERIVSGLRAAGIDC